MKNNKGVTLIALVVTIIVLLILAAVTISMLRGENGIIKQAQNANDATIVGKETEAVNIAYSMRKAKSNSSQVKENELKNELIKNGEKNIAVSSDKSDLIVKFNDTNHSYRIDQNGNIHKEEPTDTPANMISKTTSYVGYYADLDPTDGKIDGIIYADLAVGNQGSGQWGDTEGKYTIPKVDKIEELKDYYISQTNYNGNDANGKGFGTKDVISPTGTGTDRFYIMALTDIDGQINRTGYDWYNAAYSYNNNKGMEDFESTTFIGFGKGKTNTATMISKWNTESYGDKNQCSDGHLDMWGQIQEKVNNGWFVPSKEEWEAFAGELGISENSSNEKYYGNFGLSSSYWSSSQGSADGAWYAIFEMGFMVNYDVNDCNCVRLSATF